jgi:SOS response regulatory protein OraA/RecX
MASVTALRELSGGRAEVEVDGKPWRTLPTGVVARVGLFPGTRLDRARLRALRRELRRNEALEAAGRALRARDLSSRRVDERLRARGFSADERAEAVGMLERVGAVNDERFAHGRAASLARRGRGDAAIRWELEHEGISPALVGAAIAALEPEDDRAARIIDERGGGPRTARFLAARGFGEAAVERAVARRPDAALG